MVRNAATGLFIACFALVGCTRQESQRKGPPNVVLIIMDTVRADHLGCYGYGEPTSPYIDGFARNATLYERAVASAPWSIPSHASIFCGKDPFQHGAHRSKVGDDTVVNPLPLGNLTLAEMFSAEGYATGAIAANEGYLDPRWQMDQGFQTYDAELAHGDVITRRVSAWLDSVSAGPFFLVVNYMDAHKPYNTTPRRGFPTIPAKENEQLWVRLKARNMARYIPEDLVQRVVAQYDAGIANLDAHVGELLDRLEAQDLLDNTIVVLTADHGEAFGEHQMVFHGNDVYEPEVSVPLIVKTPGQQGAKRVSEVTSVSDIPRLILGHMGAELEERYASEFPNAPGNHPVITENYYSVTLAFASLWQTDQIRRAIYDWPYKYIQSSVGESELYQLENDPGELRNLVAEAPDVARGMAKALEDYIVGRGEATDIVPPPELTPEEVKKLKALGYIGH